MDVNINLWYHHDAILCWKRFSSALHGINNEYSFGTIMLNVGISIGTGILIQGAFAGLDAYTGKLSNAVLQNYALDGH